MTGRFEIREALESPIFRDFVHLPYSLYRQDPHWVPPLVLEEKAYLDSNRNPFYHTNQVALFVCYENGKPKGRIAAILNQDHIRIHRDRSGFFGFFETVNDPRVAEKLVSTASEWVKQRGADRLRGPTSFSLNNISGLLTDGFNDSPAILMPYNPPFYVDLLKKTGFETAMRFFAYEISDETISLPASIGRLEERLLRNGITFRCFDPKHPDREAGIIAQLFNLAWRNNWGFVPTSEREASDDFKRVKIFFKPDLVLIAEHEGVPIGFSLALPDINQVLKPLNGRLFPFNWLRLLRNLNKIDRIRVALMGVRQDFRNRGVDLVFYKRTFENGNRHGYHRAELSWILENNEMMNRVLLHINARKTKTYQILEKKI